jgi:hypothetical protein
MIKYYYIIIEKIKKYFILLFILAYAVIALSSGLKAGILIGTISIFILFVSYKSNKSELLLLFYVLTYFLGLFKLISIKETFIFDMTFLISNILIFYIIFNKQILNKHFLYLQILILLSIIINIMEFNNMYYQTISLFNYFIVFGVLLYKHKNISKNIANMVIILCSFVIFIGLLQMFGLQVNFTSSFQVSNIDFFGFNLSRPSGVSGGIYKAGTKVLVALFLIYRYIEFSSFYRIFKKYKYFYYIIIGLAIFSATLSQRSLLLGIVILLPIAMIYKMKISAKMKTFILLITAILGFTILPFAIYYLDASNAMKFFMWMDVWETFISSSWINIIFGHGPFSVAYILMGQDYGELAKLYTIEGWDIAEIKTLKLPHNVYIQAMYDHGIIYLTVYLFLIYKAINIYFAKKNPNNNILFYLIFILFINFALHNGIMNITLTLLFVYFKEQNNTNLINKKI